MDGPSIGAMHDFGPRNHKIAAARNATSTSAGAVGDEMIIFSKPLRESTTYFEAMSRPCIACRFIHICHAYFAE
jgi:hypothetical protein